MAVLTKFERLVREQCKAAIMVEGLTGKGKSGLALMIGYALAGGFKESASPEEQQTAWEKIFTADTENRSLNLFVGIDGTFGGKFGQPYGMQITSEDGYAPSNYLDAREAAIAAGAAVFIADSVTHMWTAKGGVLDIVNDIKAQNPKMDNYRVWGDPLVASEKQKLINVIRDHRCHVITTVRVKEKFGMEFNSDKNKNEVVSLGEQQLQQEGLKYEPDLVLHMVHPGKVFNGIITHPRAKVVKSRYAILAEGEEYDFTPELCDQIRLYLEDGEDPETLLELQRQDYIEAIKNILDSKGSLKAIWQVLKTDAGYKDTKLADMPLDALKKLYSQLTAE